jgi:hypothetical protein
MSTHPRSEEKTISSIEIDRVFNCRSVIKKPGSKMEPGFLSKYHMRNGHNDQQRQECTL